MVREENWSDSKKFPLERFGGSKGRTLLGQREESLSLKRFGGLGIRDLQKFNIFYALNLRWLC